MKSNSDLTRQIDTLKQENEKLKKDMDILTDRQTIELLQKDKDIAHKDKEIGRLMEKLCKCNDK